jgi:hypothetical protein
MTVGVAGGPSMLSTPGGEGMMSPIRTSARPPMRTPLDPVGPITKGYGNPQTEFTIKQSEPDVASGNPPTVMTGGKMPTIVPMSGGPEAPGVTITAHPIVTGGPGIVAALPLRPLR